MFKLEIETGNAAMQTPEDVAGVLRETAEWIMDGATEGRIRDVNGNTVGSYEFEQPGPEERHLDELHAIGYTADDLEPLRDIEAAAHADAEDYCNVEGFDYETARARTEADVADLFGGREPEGFFVNGDPRGYALKLQSGTGALNYRDWGDFEILAPDFN